MLFVDLNWLNTGVTTKPENNYLLPSTSRRFFFHPFPPSLSLSLSSSFFFFFSSLVLRIIVSNNIVLELGTNVLFICLCLVISNITASYYFTQLNEHSCGMLESSWDMKTKTKHLDIDIDTDKNIQDLLSDLYHGLMRMFARNQINKNSFTLCEIVDLLARFRLFTFNIKTRHSNKPFFQLEWIVQTLTTYLYAEADVAMELVHKFEMRAIHLPQWEQINKSMIHPTAHCIDIALDK